MDNTEEAQVQTTGMQFVKNGIALNFMADPANNRILMKGSKEIPLSVTEAKTLVGMLNNLIAIVENGNKS
jgi:hypothetical protein